MQSAGSTRNQPQAGQPSADSRPDSTPLTELLDQWLSGMTALGASTFKLAIADTRLAVTSAARILVLLLLIALQIAGLWLLALSLLVAGLETAGLSRTPALLVVFLVQLVVVFALARGITAQSRNLRFNATITAITANKPGNSGS